MDGTYDVIIIGAGPAGLTAGIYATRAKLRTLILERERLGGKIMDIELIENYPGLAQGVSGNKIGSNMLSQAMDHDVGFQLVEVERIEIHEKYKIVKTDQGDYVGKAIIISGGARHKKLGVPGEKELSGHGVGYCAVCEGSAFADRVVAIAGGGDAGITEALYLARLASKAILIELMPELTASKVLQDRAYINPKMEIRCGTKIVAIVGDGQVRALQILNMKTGQTSVLEVDGIFVYVGIEPNTDYLKGVVPLDREGQILVNDRMETEIPGFFAAGDIRHHSGGLIVTAAADGAIAALSAEEFLSKEESFNSQ